MIGKPVLVVAIGGNALARRGERLDWATQSANAARAAELLAPLAERWRLVLTHGNGPQVGILAAQSEGDPEHRVPLEVLDAESEGMVGYLLAHHLGRARPDLEVAVLLTQVLVDRHDPAFRSPTKPVGPMMDAASARRHAGTDGWSVVCERPDDPGLATWRRVVASPTPLSVVELRSIRLLSEAGVVVICVGGGGIPVADDPLEGRIGVEAVVDKDLSSAVLAIAMDADRLVLLTDVDGIHRDFGTSRATRIASVEPGALRALALPAGSMGPKAEAACRFVEATNRQAVIGSLDEAADVVNLTAGTVVGSVRRR